jgi:holliday junction DNA helicase RuvA
MIASVAGAVAAVAPEAAVVEVGGVGLRVLCTPATLARLRVGEPARLATSLVVRETELTLYGFGDADERDVFEILQSAGGVGPKLAQAILGMYGPDAIRQIVASDDLAALTKVPGIGRKGAQRIILDLAGRLAPPSAVGPLGGAVPVPVGPAGAEPLVRQVTAALVGLGYSAREADDAIAAATATDAPDVGGDPAALLRACLAALRPR